MLWFGLIPNEFIRVSTDIFLPILVKLLNKVLQTGRMPELWNLSMITALCKSGDPGNCSNYRGLSVTSCLGKLFNRILQTRLTNYLESEGMFSHFQAGFRKGYRTTDIIFILKTLMNKYLIKEKKLCGFFESF